MKFKKKISILIISMIAVLFLLPLLFLNFSKPHEGMGLMMILFFIVNPSTTAIINSMIGKDIKKLWGIPILFSIVFLFSYWMLLKEIILELVIYAIFYLLIGIFFMVFFYLCKRKR